jgi:hypothetical protein
MRRGPLSEIFSRLPAGKGISVVGLLAYDWKYAIKSIRSYYAIADEIVLGLDADRLSWSRKPFRFDKAACFRALRSMDPLKKIRVIEGDFHALPGPMQNDTAERNALSMRCRAGNWVLQIDADEEMINPAQFAEWLKGLRWKRQAMANWQHVFKVIGDKALVIDVSDHWIPVATTLRGAYFENRNTREWALRSPLKLLHFSWGRSEMELRAKLKHWSHSPDFDTAALLKLWKSVNLKNYRDYKDFHPLDGPLWPGLKVVDLKALQAQSLVRDPA